MSKKTIRESVIRSLINKGLNTAQIGRELKITRRAMIQYIKSHSIPYDKYKTYRRNYVRRTYLRDTTIVRMAANLHPIKDIACKV